MQLADEGVAITRIAKEVGMSLPTVLLERSRFEEHGLDGLADAPLRAGGAGQDRD